MGTCLGRPAHVQEEIKSSGQYQATERCARQLLGPTVRIEAKLGEGGYGTVFLASWKHSQVAIKVTTESRSEASLSLTLRHPHIVSTFVAKTHQGQLWIVQEHCRLGALRGYLRSHRMSYRDKISIAYNVASGMLYLAEQNVIHGDLNANNVLLSTTGTHIVAKVADFGNSRSTAGWICSHRVTDTRGTVTHVAPELLSQGLLTAAADVYAFGILLHELYTGQAAYTSMHLARVMQDVVSNNMRPVFPAGTPEGYATLATTCWNGMPKARPGWQAILEVLGSL